MKNKLIALSGVLLSMPVLAEGTTPAMDTTAAENMVNYATTGLSGLLTACVPYITSLFLAGLAIWGAYVVFKLIKRAFSKAT